MSKKLEETFNLPDIKEAINELEKIVEEGDDENSDIEVTKEETAELKKALTLANKIDAALPVVGGHEEDDIDMNRYAKQAEEAFKDLMELGMNVEARHSGEIVSAAQRMLKNAIEATTVKMKNKRIISDQQLKKYKIDQDNSTNNDSGEIIEGESYIIADRNDMLKNFMKAENSDVETDVKKDK